MHRVAAPVGSAAPPTARRAAASRRPQERAPQPSSRGLRARGILKPLLTLAPEAVFTVRASGRVGLWNPAAVAITGRRRRAAQRQGAASLFRDPEELARILADAGRHGRATRDEVLLVSASGEDVPVRVFATRLASRGGRTADADRWLLMLHDLSEVHRIRRRLIETEKLSAMARIAGSVAHEFRNPLNSLFLATDLLEDELGGEGVLRETIAPTLAAIREEIERLNQIITHYLALSKIATRRPEVVDLKAVLREFAEEWRPRAAARGVDLALEVGPGRQLVAADPNQVRRVLVNLVENALDAVAGEPGAAPPGPVRRRPASVVLALRPSRRWVRLVVEDDGPGIPADQREKVFEAFFTSKARGSGLGLYIVREILLAHGGAVRLGAARGGGLSVSTRWPRATSAGGRAR